MRLLSVLEIMIMLSSIQSIHLSY